MSEVADVVASITLSWTHERERREKKEQMSRNKKSNGMAFLLIALR